MRTRLMIPLSAALLVLLAGCSASGADESMDAGGEAVPYAEPSQTQPDDASSEGGPIDESQPGVDPVEQAIIVTASAQVVDDDPIAAATAIADLADEHGGFVADRQEGAGSDDSSAWASITVRVPAADLETVMDALADVGEVRDTSMSQVDVTQQVRDIEVRIESLQASIDRLTELLGSAGDTATLLDIEEQLTQRTSELESLLAEQAYLEDQVSLSTLSVSISEPAASPEDPQTFLDGLVAGWHGLVAFVGTLAVALGAMLPTLTIVALIAIIVWLLVRRTIRRRRAAAPAPDRAPRVENPAAASSTSGAQHRE